jgi:hypothetical protein
MKWDAVMGTRLSSLPCISSRGREILAAFSRSRVIDSIIAAPQPAFQGPCQTKGSFTYISTCSYVHSTTLGIITQVGNKHTYLFWYAAYVIWVKVFQTQLRSNIA